MSAGVAGPSIRILTRSRSLYVNGLRAPWNRSEDSSPDVGGVDGDAAVTVTLASSLAFPPAPVHVTVYDTVFVGDTETVPLVAFPVENPEPVQLVALVEDQESEEGLPSVMLEGFAKSDAVGAAGGGGEMEPPLYVKSSKPIDHPSE